MYTTHFGFTNPPFTRNSQAITSSPTYQAVLNCLRRGFDDPQCGLLLLTGPSGVGKTTLLHHLARELADRAYCIFIWNAHQNFGELLDYLCESLTLTPAGTDRDAKLKALETYGLSQWVAGRELVLVMDDAHLLPEETLAGLSQLARLEVAGRKLFQIILSGDLALGSRLANRPAGQPLAQDIARHCKLNGLADQEIIGYIQAQLKMAGYRGNPLFEQNALSKIAAYAQGLPRLVNLICSQALFLAYLKGEASLRADLIDEVAADQRLQKRSIDPIVTAVARPASTAAFTLNPVTAIFPAAIPNPAKAQSDAAPADETPAISSDTALADEIPAIPVEPGILSHRPRHRYRPWLTLSFSLLAILSIGLATYIVDSRWFAELLESLPRAATLVKPPVGSKEPIPSLTADAAIAKRIQALLHKAGQQMNSFDYVLPKGESALDSYRAVLQLDPGNREALQGIGRLKASFLDWAELAELRGDLIKAREYLEIVLAIDPEDKPAREHLSQIAGRQGSGVETREGAPAR